jgi:hypothetical protein
MGLDLGRVARKYGAVGCCDVEKKEKKLFVTRVFGLIFFVWDFIT